MRKDLRTRLIQACVSRLLSEKGKARSKAKIVKAKIVQVQKNTR